MIEQSCSVQWADPEVAVWGTAPVAAFWVALEQNGPWGSRAWTQSGLPPELGAAIEQACLDHGGRGLLIRNPAAHPRGAGLRRAYVAGALGSRPWLLTGHLDDPTRLLDLPFGSLSTGPAAAVSATVPWLVEQPDGLLLVCANGRRDPCCARSGGPLGRQLLTSHPNQVWESSHLGGHRFAPTALVLPTGQVLGRLTRQLAEAALAAASRRELVGPGGLHDRGRSHLAPELQVADAFVRAAVQATDPARLLLEAATVGSGVTVRDTCNGQVKAVVLERRALSARPESCGAQAIPATAWEARWREE